MPKIQLPQGEVHIRDEGAGPAVVLLHGLLVNGTLWDRVVPLLAPSARCVVPDLPLGSHATPLRRDADVSPRGVARLVADLLAELELDDVTLVGNDTGGAIAQLVAAHHPERIGRLLLTNCDMYENFLPPEFGLLERLAAFPPALTALMQLMRLRAVRRRGFSMGMRDYDDALVSAWVAPYFADRGVRRDYARFLHAIDSRETVEAVPLLRDRGLPILLAWGDEDTTFGPSWPARFQADVPNARVETITRSRLFVPLDAPQQLAHAIAGFRGEVRAAA